MNNSLKATLLCGSITLLVTGCGGGGGGSIAVVKRPFTSFSAIPPNTIVDIEGQSVEYNYVANTTSMTSYTDLSTDPTAKATLTFDSNGDISKLSIATDKGTISWDSSTDSFISFSPAYPQLSVSSADDSKTGLVILPSDPAIDLGWDYQTFGLWFTETSSGTASSGRAGSISVGSRTDGNAVPTTGTASFTGLVSGIYIDATGAPFVVDGFTTLNADFVGRSLVFTTSDSYVDDGVNYTPNNNLNLSGTLTYSAGSNNFSGAVNGTGLTGSANGYFYGPTAEEAGGTFSLTGTGVENYTGAFGAKR